MSDDAQRSSEVQQDAALVSGSSLADRLYFTRGDELMSPRQFYTRAFENESLRAIARSYVALDDHMLARALAASATGYACADYRAITTSDVRLMVTDDEGQRVDWSPFGARFMLSARRLLYDTVLSVLIWGRAYLKKLYNPSGYPTGLMWLNPLNVREIIANGVVTGYEVREAGFKYVQYSPNHIIYVQAFDTDPDGRGLSKFELALRAIGIEQGLAVYAAAFFTNSARPDGVLILPDGLDPAQQDKARDQWRQLKGSANAHRTAVMPTGTEWKPIQTTPKDLMMSELKREQRTDIAAIMQVDLSLLGVLPTSDPLSAQGTFNSKKTAHIIDVAIPTLRLIVLPALNEQWASRDFGAPYLLDVDEEAVPALSETQLAKTSTAAQASAARLLDYGESRSIIGKKEDRPDYFKRPVDETLSATGAPIIGINESRLMTGRPPLAVIPAGDDLIMVQGNIVPVSALMQIALANAQRLQNPVSPSPFGGAPLSGQTPPELPPENPTLPPGAPDRDETPPDSTVDTSFCIALDLSNHPHLLELQQGLKGVYAAYSIKWNKPESFHVTLMYAPKADEAMVTRVISMLEAEPMPELTLRIGSLWTFNNPGECALHFRIKENAALRQWQERVYAICKGVGMSLSPYSDPRLYNPHVTMGYSEEKLPRQTWSSKVPIQSDTVIAWHGNDNEIYRGKCGNDENRVDESVDEQEPLPESDPVIRSGLTGETLQLVLPLSGHSYVRAAAHELSGWLTAQGVLSVDWQSESEWCIPVASMSNVTPTQVAKFVRERDYSTIPKVDVMSGGFMQVGDAIGLAIPLTDAQKQAPFDALRASLVLDLQAYAADGQTPTAAEYAWVCLGWLTGSDVIDWSAPNLPTAQYPLVVSTLAVQLGNRNKFVWSLRNQSLAQEKEIDKWGYIARRNLARAQTFRTEWLDASSAGRRAAWFIRWMLDPDATEPVDVEDVFATALDMLRSYSDTRASFVARVEELLRQAVNGDISKTAFGSRLRSALTRHGTQVVYDAFEDGGVPIESFDKDTLTLFRAWEREQSEYVSNITSEIYKEAGGLTDAGVTTRASLWGNKSLDDLYYTMLRQAAPALELLWKRNPQKDSCTDCVKRDGQSLTIDEWGQIGFPRDRRLECGGWECGCSLLDSTGKVYRAFRSESEPDYTPMLEWFPHQHDHDHHEEGEAAA